MSYSYQECLKRIKQAYPDMYPVCYVLHEGRYYFNLFQRGENKENALTDIHFVDIATGGVSGNIPTMYVASNKELAGKFKNPTPVHAEDQVLEHGIKKNYFNGGSVIRTNSSRQSQDNKNYYGISQDSYLEHHGIKGMQWGVRNGPPYPLDTKTHNQVVSESGSVKKKKPVPENPETVKGLGTDVAIATATYLLPAIATVVATHIIKNNTHKNYKKQSDDISKEGLKNIAEVKDFSDQNPPRTIKGKHSPSDDMAAVNPKFGYPIEGNAQNCMLCSVAYDLRRRGYDVTAKMCKTGMYSDKVANEIYENPKIDTIRKPFSFGWNFQKAQKAIEEKYPEGSRGVLTVSAPLFGGHAMAFEISNGKLVIRDAQENKIRRFTDDEFKIFDPKSIQVIRTDNLKLKMNKVSIAAAELKSNWKSAFKKEKDEFDKAAKGINDEGARQKAMKTYAERKRNYEQLWMNDHPDAPDTPASKRAMEKWVELQLNKK